MMRIFQIQPDVQEYQTIAPTNQGAWGTGLLTFDCTPKPGWRELDTFVVNPSLKRGNFFHLCPGALVFDEHAYQALDDLLEIAGEILPLRIGDQKAFLLNVTACPNALDSSATEWRMSASGQRLGIKRYAFEPSRLFESRIFKIPESCRVDVLSYETAGDNGDGLLARYSAGNLKGLRFDEVFNAS